MRSLYEIGEDLSALEEMLTDLDGEIPEGEIGAAIEEWFDQLGEERDEKIKAYCALIEMMGFAAEACEEETRRLGKLKRADENGAERLKNRLKEFFQSHGIQKLDLRIFKPHIRTNGGALTLIVPPGWESDPASAPEAFHKVEIKLDTAAIREAIRNDEETHGARLGERGNHLRIR
jgi:Siphovirus Gp157